MKRIVLTTVFASVAVASAAAQSASAGTSNTVRIEPPAAPRYQVVVRARLVGTFQEVSGLDAVR